VFRENRMLEFFCQQLLGFYRSVWKGRLRKVWGLWISKIMREGVWVWYERKKTEYWGLNISFMTSLCHP
jgi:hypothetical protein